MSKMENNFTRVLRGDDTGKVPFWEVWFHKYEMLYKALGKVYEGKPAYMSPERTPDFLPFARRMGWEYLRDHAGERGLPGASGTASDGTTHYVQGGFHRLEQLEAFEPPDLTPTYTRLETRLHQAHEAGLALVVYLPWCFHSVATSMGLEAFAYKTVDDIDFLHAAMEFTEEGNRRVINEVLVPLDVDAVLFDGDCAYKNGLMVRPEVFRELVFDKTARTVAPLEEADIPYVLHSDGKCDELLPILIELGFSAFHGVEAAANDLGEIKERFGKDITLVGNMDVDFLTHAAPDEVRRKTLEMLEIGAPGGRYMAACNTSPCDYIPDENYLAMVDTIRAFGT